uniref:CASTOR ACT domain-containing protein n=1 Tax=Gorilla gorilla gorilla TaxID=9595 RepID=G3S3H8_GORGO
MPSSEHLSVADATWLALNVVSGGGSFSSSQPIGVTKIAKSVIAPLADQNISVFMLSTYQTDFILVRERDLPFVTHTLSSEFTILRVVNGETVAAENLGITNGFVKPKLFPSNLLFTSASGELWKMVRIGGQPLGFDECGIVAQISEPLAAADIPAYYISTFKFDHALVPEENINGVISALKVSQAEKH